MSDSVKKWFEMQAEKEHKDVLYTHMRQTEKHTEY